MESKSFGERLEEILKDISIKRGRTVDGKWLFIHQEAKQSIIKLVEELVPASIVTDNGVFYDSGWNAFRQAILDKLK